MTMIWHDELNSKTLARRVRVGEIRLAGNVRLRIYGKLHCWSGKKMSKKNRVFFESEEDAWNFGFRPCAHCMKTEYGIWKAMQYDEKHST